MTAENITVSKEGQPSCFCHALDINIPSGIPVNIYEVHLGTFWNGGVVRYRAIAGELALYLVQMGYTHVALLDVCSASNGMPNPAYGSVDDFQYFLDIMHRNSIGVVYREWTGTCIDAFLCDSDWVRSVCGYLSVDPIFRTHYHCQLVDKLEESDHEKRLLAAVRETVSGDCRSLIEQCYGEYDQKFATARLFFAYMMAHPGKKLTFMGCEYGQFRAWEPGRGTEWFLCDYPAHDALRRCVADLNHLYRNEPCLYRQEHARVCANRKNENTVAFIREDGWGGELLAVFHFAPCIQEECHIIGLKSGVYEVVFTTESVSYGGNGTSLTAEGIVGKDGVMHLTLPPLCAIYFKKK